MKLLPPSSAISHATDSPETFVSAFQTTERFIMSSVITNIYNKKTKEPTLMELFTATGKLKEVFFWQIQVFDVCTTDERAHSDTIFNMGASIFFTAAMIRAFRSARSRGNGGTGTVHEMHVAQ